MKLYLLTSFCCLVFYFTSTTILVSSCAQIGMPTGGPKDSLAPTLVKATPSNNSLNVKSNKITLEFNEYIELQDVQQNVLVSPFQTKNPTITATPRSVIIKFKDSLLPNTTYSVDFGEAIKDINEGNVYKNLKYTFSTGNRLDSLSIIGKVIMASTGLVDSTIMVYLHANAVDSTITKKKPNYISKVDGEGNFEFTNLPNALFKIYALKDGDGSKTYNAATELFAFADDDIASAKNDEVTLHAFANLAEKEATLIPKGKTKIEKKLKFTNTLASKQDLLLPIELSFNNALKDMDTTHFYLTDTSFNKIKNVTISLDSTRKRVLLTSNWLADMPMVLVLDTLAVSDSVGNKLSKNDTIYFSTKKMQDYGKLYFKFNNISIEKKPVLIFLIDEDIKYSYTLTTPTFTNSLIIPAEYTIRILYDTDRKSVV